MADKYLDTTLASGLNDGTSIANAWQDMREVMTNTQAAGTYAAGDVINVRSHDGTTDITEDLGATTLAQAEIGSEQLPVTWLIDDGTVWPQGGIFTMQHGGDTALRVISATFSDGKFGNYRNLYLVCQF